MLQSIAYSLFGAHSLRTRKPSTLKFSTRTRIRSPLAKKSCRLFRQLGFWIINSGLPHYFSCPQFEDGGAVQQAILCGSLHYLTVSLHSYIYLDGALRDKKLLNMSWLAVIAALIMLRLEIWQVLREPVRKYRIVFSFIFYMKKYESKETEQ